MDNNFTDSILDDTLVIEDYTYKTWEDIPVSSLWFNSNTSQICFIAIDKNVALKRINEISLPANTIAYEYRENIKPKENEVILQVELDTSNMLDTTNIAEFQSKNNVNINNIPLIRMVKPVIHLGYTNYMIVYQIKDNRAVKNIQKIQ